MELVNRQVPLASSVVGWWRGGRSMPLAGKRSLTRLGGIVNGAGPGVKGSQ